MRQEEKPPRRKEDLRSAIISIRVTHNEAFQEEASCTVTSGVVSSDPISANSVGPQSGREQQGGPGQGLEPHPVALRGPTSGKTGPAKGTMTGKGRRKKKALPTLRPRTVAKSAPQGPLPPGWIEAFDPTSRLPYYHHPPTQRSQWERPPPQPQQCLLPPWIEAFDPTRGIPYYYNPATGMSQWDRPAGFQLPLGGQAMPWMLTPAGTMAGWTEVVDGRSGHRYYFNRLTGEVAWQLPQVVPTSPPATINTPVPVSTSVQSAKEPMRRKRMSTATSGSKSASGTAAKRVDCQHAVTPATGPTPETELTVATAAEAAPSQHASAPLMVVAAEMNAAVATAARKLTSQSAITSRMLLKPDTEPTLVRASNGGPSRLAAAQTSTLAPGLALTQVQAPLTTVAVTSSRVMAGHGAMSQLAATQTIAPTPTEIRAPLAGVTVTITAVKAENGATTQVASTQGMSPKTESIISAGAKGGSGTACQLGLGDATTSQNAVSGVAGARPLCTTCGGCGLLFGGRCFHCSMQPKAATPANLSAPSGTAAPTQPAGKPAPKRARKRLKHPTDKPPASELGVEVNAEPPPAKRARKTKRKRPLYTSPVARLGSDDCVSDVQLPTEILETIVRLVAAAKPRTEPRTPHWNLGQFGLGDFYVRDPDFELRATERLAAMDLADLCRVSKEWRQGVRSVGWKTLLAGVRNKGVRNPSTGAGVGDAAAQEGSASDAVRELKERHEFSRTIVATKAAAEYKISAKELKEKVKPWKLKRNPYYRGAAKMRIYKTKDVLEAAVAKHGGVSGLRKKIEKCDAMARKRAAGSGKQRPVRAASLGEALEWDLPWYGWE